MLFTLHMRQLLRHVCNAGALITWLQAHDSSAQTGDVCWYTKHWGLKRKELARSGRVQKYTWWRHAYECSK